MALMARPKGLVGFCIVLLSQHLQAANVVLYLYSCGIDPVPNIRVNVGDSVTWQSRDLNIYTLESYTGEWQSFMVGFDSSKFTFAFNRPGTFYYRSVGSLAITSGTITVVPLTNSPPAVTIISPVDGFSFVPIGVVTMQASTTNSPSNVVQIAYFAGTNLVAIATNAPYRVVTQGYVLGTNALTAQMTDAQGLISTSPPVKIHLANYLFAVVSTPHPLPGGRFAFNYNSSCGHCCPQCSVDLIDWYCPIGPGLGTLCQPQGTIVDELHSNSPVVFYRVVNCP